MAKNNNLVAPFLKWVGGKRQLMPSIVEHLPENIKNLNYSEPFIGGGAVLFHLQPKNAIINDFNEELVNVYNVIKNNLSELIADLKKHDNNADYFYEIRGLDRTEQFNDLTPVQRASRIIFLNKTCFNGLWRVNSSGDFNVPSNGSKRFRISWLALQRCWLLFRDHATLSCGGYAEFLWSKVRKGDFVFLDPPYIPLSTTSSFTSYTQDGWTDRDNLQLADILSQLDSIGVKFLMTNSSSPLVYELFGKWNIQEVKAHRFVKALSGSGGKRDKVEETVITNY